MPVRRRVTLMFVGWAGLFFSLVAAGCRFEAAFLEDPSAEPSSTAAKPGVNPPAPQAPTRSPFTLTSATDPVALPNAPSFPTSPGYSGFAGTVTGPVESAPPPAVEHNMPAGPGGSGCAGCGAGGGGPDGQGGGVPTELDLLAHPPYMVEPPDILLIDTIRLTPRPPYVVNPLDVLLIRVAEPLPNQPIDGTYTVGPDGTISLGFSYGLIRVAGLSIEQVSDAIRRQLSRVLRNPVVSVGLVQYQGVQLVRGQHLVRQDGTIDLGTYGCVFVTGLTLPQVKLAIERQLSKWIIDPQVSVDVAAYNSKAYYVIIDGAGYGEQVYRLPIVGKETVLDAISNIQGLPPVASKKKIWVARPSPCCSSCNQILPVDWKAITQGGSTCTNYQIFPGDRVYVRSNPLIEFDNRLAQFLSPIERILGITLLVGTIEQTFRNNTTGSFVVTGR